VVTKITAFKNNKVSPSFLEGIFLSVPGSNVVHRCSLSAPADHPLLPNTNDELYQSVVKVIVRKFLFSQN